MRFGKMLKVVSKENLIVNQYVIKNYLKAKIKSYNAKINANFHNSKVPKEDCQYICLSKSLLDCVFRTGINYYPQVFLEERKYVVKEKKILMFIIYDSNFFRFC